MDEQKIIEAIRSENFIDIEHRESGGKKSVIRKICPYDIYPRNKKNKSTKEKGVLLGYEIGNPEKGNHVANIFLDQIKSVDVLSDEFDGEEVRRLIKLTSAPHIKRDW